MSVTLSLKMYHISEKKKKKSITIEKQLGIQRTIFNKVIWF